MSLQRLLGQVADVYDELVDASLPGRTGEPSTHSPDPWDRPAPGNLSVMEHRHLLVRGLRWWVDAVSYEGRPIGSDVRAMCRVLATHAAVMDDGDRATLAGNMREWLDEAWPFLGDGPPEPRPLLPDSAWEQRVRVADAARILGCTVRTIQRRVPADQRPDGRVKLGDAAPRCERCDLIVGQCEHTT